MNNILTNSAMTCARTCFRKYELCYEQGIRPAQQPAALTMGSAFHAAADEFEKNRDSTNAILVASKAYEIVPEWVRDITDWNEQRVTVETLLAAYFIRYENYPLETIASELSWKIPLPGTKKIKLAGKIDRIVKLPDGRLAILETKTTGDSIEQTAPYWERLRMDSQISLYVYAAREIGYNVSTVLYDVIHKPGMGLKRATPIEKRLYKKDGTLYANCRDTDEAPDEFRARLMDDVVSRPEFYFMRVETARTDRDIIGAKAEWYKWASLLNQNSLLNRWPMNPSACYGMFGKCPYFDICSNNVDVSNGLPDGFIKVVDVHPELVAN